MKERNLREEEKETNGSLKKFQVPSELSPLSSGDNDVPTSSVSDKPLGLDIADTLPTLSKLPKLSPQEEKVPLTLTHEEALELEQSTREAPKKLRKKQAEAAAVDPEFFISATRGTLTQHPAFSIFTHSGQGGIVKKSKEAGDEFNEILACFAGLGPGEKAAVRISLRTYPGFEPMAQQALNEVRMTGSAEAPDSKHTGIHLLRKAKKLIEKLAGFVAEEPPAAPQPIKSTEMSEGMKDSLKEAGKKMRAANHLETSLRVIVSGKQARAQNLLEIRDQVQKAIEVVYSDTNTGQGFKFVDENPLDALLGYMPLGQSANTVLSNVELAELMSVPDEGTHSGHDVRLHRANIKWLPLHDALIVPDPYTPPKGVIPFGLTNEGSDKERIVGMSIADLAYHLYFCGATGTGKSNLMQWIAYGLIKNGETVIVVDPHGELVDDIILNIAVHAPERIKDVLVADFGNRDMPIAFNPLDVSNYEEIEGTVASMREMFLKKEVLNIDPAGAPRAANYVSMTATALCEANLHLPHDLKLTLLHITTFLNNDDFRHLIMEFCENQGVREYFSQGGVYESLSPKARSDHLSPIMRALNPLNTNETFANVFGQSINKLDYTKFIKEGKIILLRFPQFSPGTSAVTNLISGLTIPLLLRDMGVWSKHGSAFLLIDEFQNYASESYIKLLAEARKFKLRSIATSQIPTSLPSDIQTAVYGNARNKLTLQLDRDNVGKMARNISGANDSLQNRDVASLPNYYGYGNLILNNHPTGPFTFKALAPIVPNGEKESHREKFAKQIQEIEQLSSVLLSEPRDKVMQQRRDYTDNMRANLGAKLRDRQRHQTWDDAPHVAGLDNLGETSQPSDEDFDEDW